MINLTTHERAGRTVASSGSKWEPAMGYSRAVRAGNLIAVTGTVGVKADGTYSPSLAEQTQRSLDIVLAAIEKLGGKPENVIRTRIFTTQIGKWQEIASVHGKIFGEIRPCTTLVGVAELIDKEALIEIEADAVVP
jgi:enamine deaminase RidA (YjgF/YER057c/UK114 family)